MDPATSVVGVAALVALYAGISHAGCRLSRRARLADAEIRRLRDELQAERYAASHDHLTGLPNRRAFKARAHSVVIDPDRPPLLGLLIDLDDFKHVNDTLGHAAGDEVLVALAARIAGCAEDHRGRNLVARLSGDEFVVLLAAEDNGPAHDQVVARFAREIAAPLDVAGHSVRVTASIGVTRVDGPMPLTDVLARADAAMYEAKARHAREALITPAWELHTAAASDRPAPGAPSPSRETAAVRRARQDRTRAGLVPVHRFAGSTAGSISDTLGWEASR